MGSEGTVIEKNRPQRIKRRPLKLLDGANSEEDTEPTEVKKLKSSKTTRVKSVKNNSAKAAKKFLPGVRKEMNNKILELSQNTLQQADDEDENVDKMPKKLSSRELELMETDSTEAEKALQVIPTDEYQDNLLKKIGFLENKIKDLEEGQSRKDKEITELKEKVNFLEDKITQYFDQNQRNQKETTETETNKPEKESGKNNNQNAHQSLNNNKASSIKGTDNHRQNSLENISSTAAAAVGSNDVKVKIRSSNHSFDILETYKIKAYNAKTLQALVKNLAFGYLLPNRNINKNEDLQQRTDSTECQTLPEDSDPGTSNEKADNKTRTTKFSPEVIDVQKIARLAIRDFDDVTKMPPARIMRYGDSSKDKEPLFKNSKDLYDYRKRYFTNQLSLKNISQWMSAGFKDLKHKTKKKDSKLQNQESEKMIMSENSNSSIDGEDNSND